jgi:hypothetical protein
MSSVTWIPGLALNLIIPLASGGHGRSTARLRQSVLLLLLLWSSNVATDDVAAPLSDRAVSHHWSTDSNRTQLTYARSSRTV